MKVVLINKTDVGGGAAVAASRLNKALHQYGIQTSLLVQDHLGQQKGVYGIDEGFMHQQKAWGRFLWERLYFLPFEKDASIRFGFSPANTGIDISDHPLVKDADIIHLHWINQGFLSLNSLRKLFALQKPVVWTQHDMWAFTGGCHYSGKCNQYTEGCSNCPFLGNPGPNDLSTRLFVKKQKIYDQAPISVVTCSKWLKELAENSKLLGTKMTHSIPNPINTELYRPMNKNEQRQQLGLPLGKKLVLFGAANVNDPRKGMRYFLKALNLLNNRSPEINKELELVVFGKMKDDILKSLPFKVHALNFISDPEVLISLYNAADLFVLPSLQDNLPNTVMEALACGLPVAAFSTGGVPEMVDHMQNGYLAEPENAGSLADGLFEILYKANLDNYGESARNKVITNYSEEVVASQYHELYQSLLQK